jgi:hypothetical protein
MASSWEWAGSGILSGVDALLAIESSVLMGRVDLGGSHAGWKGGWETLISSDGPFLTGVSTPLLEEATVLSKFNVTGLEEEQASRVWAWTASFWERILSAAIRATLSGADVLLAGAGSLSPGGVNKSWEVPAGLTGRWMAASTWGGVLPEGEEMSRIKGSLSSTIDGHSSAIACASSEDISTVTLDGRTSWGGWKTSWLAVSTAVTEVLTNDTGLDGSSGAMKASSWGGMIELRSSCSERPGGSGIVTGEQRSYGSCE